MDSYKRAGRVLLITFAAYGVLVGVNEGEFWPFSIFPMFSQGGIPWSRAVVRDVSNERTLSWTTVTSSNLPGEPYPLLEHGVDPIDLANFVSKSKSWDDARVFGLRKMFDQHELNNRRLLVMRVHGRITKADSVIVEFVPYVYLTPEGSTLNDELAR